MDLLISYLFSQLVTQKGSHALMKETDKLLECERIKAVRDQAARVIVKALQHVHVKERIEAIEASPRKNASSYLMSPSRRNSPATSHAGSPALRRSNALNRSVDRTMKVDSAKKGKQPVPSPFSGPKSYEKYLNKSSKFNASPRPKAISSLQNVLENTHAMSPIGKQNQRGVSNLVSSPRHPISNSKQDSLSRQRTGARTRFESLRS